VPHGLRRGRAVELDGQRMTLIGPHVEQIVAEVRVLVDVRNTGDGAESSEYGRPLCAL